MRPTRALLLACVLSMVLAACTSSGEAPVPPTPTSGVASPSPSEPAPTGPDQSGLSMAVVLPHPDEVARSLEVYADTLNRVRASFGADLARVRVLNLDAPAFRRDVLTLLADDGTAFTCAFGTGALDVVEVAREFPHLRFCVVDDRIEEVPPNVVATWFRYEEAAYLLGFAAASMLPEQDPAGTIGFVAATLDAPTERVRLAFTAGARAARPSVAIAVETLDEQGTGRAEQAAETAALLYDEFEAAVLMLATGVPAASVLEEARERERLVVGMGSDLARQTTPGLEPTVLASAHARLEVGLSLPITRFLTTWEGGVVSLGFADEALVLTPGGSERWNEVRDRIADIRGRIEAGEQDLG